MAIDEDPVQIAIRQTEKESEEDSYLPTWLRRVGLSAAAATTAAILFKEHPFAINIVTTLLANSPGRFEERLMRVVKAFAERLKAANEFSGPYISSTLFCGLRVGH